MTDLIDKFFRTELTDQEDEKLSAQLESSEDEADRFVAKAEEAYYSFGLSEPKEPSAWKRFLRSSWVGWLLAVVLLGGLGLWHPWTRGTASVAPLGVSKTEPVAQAVAPAKVTTSVVKAKKEPLVAKPVEATRAAMVPTVIPTPTVVPVQSVGAPPNPGFDTDTRNLRVLVEKEAAGALVVKMQGPKGIEARRLEGAGAGVVVVRVLAANQVEVRRLYEGPLQVGKWAFKWDGVMSNGKMAPPGTYHIEVAKKP
jgi:hypothetical protein